MTQNLAEILLFVSVAINAALLLFIAGVLRKIMNDMDEPAFKRFADLLYRCADSYRHSGTGLLLQSFYSYAIHTCSKKDFRSIPYAIPRGLTTIISPVNAKYNRPQSSHHYRCHSNRSNVMVSEVEPRTTNHCKRVRGGFPMSLT